MSGSIIKGLNYIFTKFNKAIILEDDILVSKDFVEYMNSSLNFYRSNKSILSISGYNHHHYHKFINKNFKYDNFFSYRASSWGWSTWSDRWKIYKSKILLKKIKSLRSEIDTKLGLDVYYSLLDINKNKKKLWAANWCFMSMINNKVTVYPKISRTSNIGFDGSGQGGYSFKFKNNLKNTNIRNFHYMNDLKLLNIINQKIFLKMFRRNIIYIFISNLISPTIKKKVKNIFFNFNWK